MDKGGGNDGGSRHLLCEYRVKAKVAPINFVCMHVQGKATMGLHMAARQMLLPTEENRDFPNKNSDREKTTNQTCVTAERKQSDFGMFLNTLKCQMCFKVSEN